MSSLTLKIQTYGGQVKGAFVDNLLLKEATSILKRPKGRIEEETRRHFWESFLDLSNLAEICCLHDTVHFLSGTEDKDIKEFSEILDDEFLSQLVFEQTLIPYSFFTIDDIQKTRIFNRWALTVIDIWQKKAGTEFEISDEKIRNLFAGCLAEELIGTPYFPSIGISWYYIPASALILDMQMYSFLLQAYIQIKEEEVKSIQLRNLIGGLREPSIPPITSLILSKISSPTEFIEEMLILRKEMQPLRQKMAELSDFGNSNLPMNKWQKQTAQIQKEINKFIQKYELSDSRTEISRPNQKDFATLATKLGSDSPEFSLDIKKILSLGIEQIIEILKRRRIKPLPSFKKKIGQMGKISNHLNRVFGIQFETRDFHEINKLQSTYEKLGSLNPINDVFSFKNVTFLEIPEPSEFRKGIEGIIFSEMFDFDLMIKEFNILLRAKVRDNYSTIDQLLDMGFIYLSSKAIKRAKPYFLKAIEIDSNSIEAHHGLALTEEMLGNQGEAEAVFCTALTLAPKNADILNDFGKFLLSQSMANSALEYFQKATEINDEHKVAWSNLGGCLYSLKKYKQAYEAFQKAININPNFAEPYYGLGLIDEKNELFDQAIKNYQRAVELSPDEIRYVEKFALAHFKLENYKQAAIAFEKVLEEKSDNYKLFGLYANCLYLAKEYDKSIIAFEKISKINPEDPDNYAQWAYALYELGKYDEAIDKFKEAFNHDTSKLDYLIRAGRICLETSQFKKAVKHFQELLDTFPDNPLVEFWLGKSLWANSQKKVALTHFNKSIELGYDKSVTFYDFAVELDRQEDYESAILLYELALSIEPDDPESLANIAADLVELGKLDEALKNAQKACTISPTDLINLNTLGAIYARIGELSKAKEIFERIIDISNDENVALVQQAKKALQQISSYLENK